MATSILGNSAWNVYASLLGVVLLMITTPAFLRVLGEEKFGLYMLLTAVIAPFEILSAGVSQASVKFLAGWLPSGLIKESRNMVRVSLLLNGIVGVAAVVGLWFAAPWLATSVFKISNELHGDAVLSFRLTAPVWLAIQISSAYSSHVAARQAFREISIVQMVRLVLLYPGALLLAMEYGTVASIQLWSLSTALLPVVYWGRSLSRELGIVALLPGFEMTAFQRSFGFSVWQMLSSLCSAISQQSDRVLLGSLLGTSAVAVYGVAISVQQKAVQLVWSSMVSLFPAISEHADGNPLEAEKIFRISGCHLSFFGCLCYGLGALFSWDLCRLWLGNAEIAQQAGQILSVAFIAAILGAPSAQFTQYIHGHGLTRINFISNALFSIIAASVTWWCILKWGVMGAVWGIVIAVLISRPPLHWWIAKKFMMAGDGAWGRLVPIYSVPISAIIGFGFGILLKVGWAEEPEWSLASMVQMTLVACAFVFTASVSNLLMLRRESTAAMVIRGIRDTFIKKSRNS